MKNSNDTMGYQNHELPVCGAVPQPTAPPRAPVSESNEYKMSRDRVQILVVSTFRKFPCAIKSYNSIDQ